MVKVEPRWKDLSWKGQACPICGQLRMDVTSRSDQERMYVCINLDCPEKVKDA